MADWKSFLHLSIILTIMIISINGHIYFFGDVISPNRIATQPFSLTADVVRDENVSTTGAIGEIKEAGGFLAKIAEYLDIIPFLGPSIKAATGMIDLMFNFLFGYWTVLTEILPDPIGLVICGFIILPIQLIGLTALFVEVVYFLRRLLPF